MTDYADKTDAELDALAAERMGPGVAALAHWSPATDANDRDEWVEWLRVQGLSLQIWTTGDTGWWIFVKYRGGKEDIGGCLDDSLGRAVLIAGLRATDE